MHGRVVTAAPNFACEYAAQRGLPAPGDDVDLSNVVLILGSEPVSTRAIDAFNTAFAPYGLPPTAIKPSYGIAEATLFVSTIAPDRQPHRRPPRPRRCWRRVEAVRVAADTPDAAAHVSCGQIARSQWCVIVDSETDTELPDGRVGEIWLHGNNVGRGYWGRPEETRQTFGAILRSDTAAEQPRRTALPAGATWLRTGDLGFYLDGELYVTGRIADLITIDGRQLYPEDVEATTAEASPIVRRGYAAAFTVPSDDRRAAGGRRRTGVGHTPRRPGARRRSHSRRSVTPTRPLGRRCPSRACGRDPAHDERQAGPPGMPCRLPGRRVRGLGRLTRTRLGSAE